MSRARRGNQLRVVSPELSTRNDSSPSPAPTWGEKKICGWKVTRPIAGSSTPAKVAARRAKASADRSNYSDVSWMEVSSASYPQALVIHDSHNKSSLHATRERCVDRGLYRCRVTRPRGRGWGYAHEIAFARWPEQPLRIVDRMYRIYPREMYTCQYPAPRSKI